MTDRNDAAPTDDDPHAAVPPWKRDFPIESASEEDITRREFTRYLVVGAGTMAAANVGIAGWTQMRRVNTGEPRRIVALADVPVGETHLFNYPSDSDPAILLRLGERHVVAFSQKCTHLGCVVYYQPEEERLHCPCHEGNFVPETGAVISGPPTRPLGRIDVEIRDDDTIWALRSQG